MSEGGGQVPDRRRGPFDRGMEIMLRSLVLFERILPKSTVVDQANPHRYDWIGVAGCAMEEILDVHRWRNGLCRCGEKLMTEGSWRLHVSVLSAKAIADDPRSPRTLEIYRAR